MTKKGIISEDASADLNSKAAYVRSGTVKSIHNGILLLTFLIPIITCALFSCFCSKRDVDTFS